MQSVKIWDPFVRLFHWSLVVAFTLEALVLDEDSHLHEQVGYFVLALIAARLVWGWAGTKYARFSSFKPSISASVEQLGDIATQRNKPRLGHSPLGALMIYNLLITIALIGITGWMMTTNMFWGSEGVEEMHEGLVVWAGASVGVHIVAVIFESRRSRVNLVKAMVTGYKTLPDSDRND
ncbi:MAG: cytochrome b/b6 domain-containing protein [Marinosulfonomonas sp.]|nr:cytochrome b/b6 domain-containing protein [Marinosulfonomonas sp.]